MKNSKYLEELKSKSSAELNEDLVAAKKELFNLRFQNASRIKEVRRNIARIKTVITEKAKAEA